MKGLISVEMGARKLGVGHWAVSPGGQLGTCGFYPCAWTVQIVRAGSAQEAISRVGPLLIVDPAVLQGDCDAHV